MSRRGSAQLTFEELWQRCGWGGRRKGAGRPRSGRARVQHRARSGFATPCPAHVTLRVRRGLPSLRSRRFVLEFRRTLRTGCERSDFRVLHYSLQRDHVHLVVEADSQSALARGMKSVGARLARAVNRALERVGAVLDGRYHLHLLRTPREVRNGLAYVLLNARKHWRQRFGSAPPARIDEASSGRWFDGWSGGDPSRGSPAAADRGRSEVARARTWLARVGWRRHGLVGLDEIPAR